MLSAALSPRKNGVEVLQDLPGADDDPDTLTLPALERFAVDGAGEVDRHAIAFGGSALDGSPSRTLALQLLDHRVEIGLLDLDARHVEREVAERLKRELGVDLERRAVGEVLAAGVGAGERLDARPTGRIQLLLRDRTRIGRADHVRHDLVAHLAAVVLAHHLLRHLAGPKPLQFRGLTHLGEPRRDGALDLSAGHPHRQPPFQPGRSLERDLVTL